MLNILNTFQDGLAQQNNHDVVRHTHSMDILS